MESKKDRFTRVATRRTNEILKKIKVLSNCANRQAYDYNEKQIDTIFSAIERKCKEAKAKFHFPKEDKFEL